MKRRAHRRSGYTLTELVIVTPLMTMLMLGAASAIGIANMAQPSAVSYASEVVKASTACEQLGAELSFAVQLTTCLPRQVTLVSPDRDGDNSADTFTYSWSGIPGDSLRRSINGSAAEVLLKGVDEFQLIYDARIDGVSGRSYVRAVEIRILPSVSGASPISTTIRTSNEPQRP